MIIESITVIELLIAIFVPIGGVIGYIIRFTRAREKDIDHLKLQVSDLIRQYEKSEREHVEIKRMIHKMDKTQAEILTKIEILMNRDNK